MAEKEVVLGLFTDVDHASMAVDELKMSGYDAKDISVIMREKEDAAKVRGEDAGSSAAKGAGTGAVIGGVAGLLIGLSAVAVPGVGPLIVGGPIAGWLGLTGAAAATVTGTVTGALAGGLIGGLIGLGLPEDVAEEYQTTIIQGGALVAVPATDGSDAEEVMRKHHADDVRTVTMSADLDVGGASGLADESA